MAPLRKVINKFYWPIVDGMWHVALFEMLECGHVQKKKVNVLPTGTGHGIMMGPYKAERRRCNACRIMGVK